MAFVHDNAKDAALNYVSGNATQIVVGSGAEPTTYAGATGAAALATGAVSGADFTVADGDVDGRKVTVAAQSGISVTSDGTAAWVAIVSGTELLLATALSATQALTSGNTVNTGSFDYTVRDAT